MWCDFFGVSWCHGNDVMSSIYIHRIFSSMRTGARYYPRSTVVPVVVPVFWSLVPTRFLTNFLYELEVGQTPAEKPESGRVCGPKGIPKVLLGRLGGRGKVRPNAGKKLFFYFLSPRGSFFCLLSLLLFLALSGGHSSLSFVPPTASPPTKLHTCVAHIPPPLLHLLRVSLSPVTP